MHSIRLLALALVLAACFSAPHDGARVGDRTAPITFRGFDPNPSTTVTLEAQNPATGVFEAFASATTGTMPTPTVFGQRWYAWSRAAAVPARFWTAGATGAMATLRGSMPSGSGSSLYLVSVREGVDDCRARMWDRTLTDFQRECSANSSPSMVICTADFTPSGPRRVCPRRLLDVIAPDGSTHRRVEPRERTVTIALPSTVHGFQAGFRGDGLSFVDVFDAPFNEMRVNGRPEQQGLSAGTFVRVFYPRGNGAVEIQRADPAAIAASLGVPWERAITIRAYDQGACSMLINWRTLLEQLQAAVEQARMTDPALAGLRPWGRAVLTPVLRPEGRGDAVGYTQQFSTSQFGVTAVLIKVLLGLSSDGRQLRSTADDVQVVITGFPGVEAAGPALEAELRTRIPRLVNDAARRSTLSGIVPILRVHARPEGAEFVLAETPEDPLFAPLRDGGLCNRPVPAGTTPTGGRFGSVFSPRMDGDPVVFGNP